MLNMWPADVRDKDRKEGKKGCKCQVLMPPLSFTFTPPPPIIIPFKRSLNVPSAAALPCLLQQVHVSVLSHKEVSVSADGRRCTAGSWQHGNEELGRLGPDGLGDHLRSVIHGRPNTAASLRGHVCSLKAEQLHGSSSFC